jgi:hypothetical protein
MAKPQVTLRQTKGTPLSYAELDTNFTNLRNATISVDADGTVVVLDLNDTLTLTPGDNVTFAVSGNEVTINSAGGTADINITASTSSNQQYLTFVDATTGTTDTVGVDAPLFYYPNTNQLVVPNLQANSVQTDEITPQTGDQVDIVADIVIGNNQTIKISDIPGSRRIECLESLIIGQVSTFGGTVNGPSINLDGSSLAFGSVSIGTGVNNDDRITFSDMVKLDSKTGSDITSFTTPQNGMMIYNSTTNKFQGYAGGAWVDLH